MTHLYPKHKSHFLLVIILLISLFIATQTPNPVHSAVVFSNMPQTNDLDLEDGSPVWPLTVIFDVPVGQDYTVNSVQARLAVPGGGGNGVANAAIYTDNPSTGGTLVVDLGTFTTIPTSQATITFTPTGANTLTNGQQYWLVLTHPGPGMQWRGSNPPIDPTGDFTFVNNGRIRNDQMGSPLQVFSLRFSVSIDADPIIPPPPPPGGGGGPVVVACTNPDGRVNSICEEPWQTAAIYCRADGAIDVYGITDGAGWLAFHTTADQIEAVGVPTGNTLLDRSENGTIRLYRLRTGEFQVNAPRWDNLAGNLPDGYVFIWDGCG